MKHLIIAAFILAALVACAPERSAAGNTTSAQSGGSTRALVQPAAAPTEQAAATETPTSEPSPTSAKPSPNTSVPAFSHVYLIIMENKEFGDIVGNSKARYINDLIEHYGLATNYTGIAHPSQPNYIALFSGSTHGIEDNKSRTVNATHLADQLEAAGKTWQVYQQNYPSRCFTGSSANGGPDGDGEYVRRHNPAISFANIANSPERCRSIVNFSQFDPAAADFEMIVPNVCNDMHDCPVSAGDSFLQEFVSRILNGDEWDNDAVLFLTWDEGDTNKGGGGHVATLVISNRVPAGFQSPAPYNHYSLLRTIQDAWGLGCLAESCSAKNMGEFFR